MMETDANKPIRNDGFDLHFTPGKGTVVGLKQACQALATTMEEEVMQSTILLANTMYQAPNTIGVMWYADWDGSAVLTRALQILTQEKGQKDLKNHSIFFNRPTINPDEVRWK
jgi:hypothetical protein